MKEEARSSSLTFLKSTVNTMAGKVSSARKGLHFLRLGHASKPLHFRIVVMGAEEVGKTALIVRYLTKKYLHEYIRGELLTYERRVSVDDKEYSLFFYDTPGTSKFENFEKKEILENVDGYVIVYSVTDRNSFITGKEMISGLYHGFEIVGYTPVCLIGNKLDLNHMTKVTHEEAETVSKFYYPNVYFRECSAADGLQSVEVAFNEFFKSVAKRKDKKKHLTANSLTVNKSPSPRRHSAGNSALSSWWRRPRSSSACEHNRQDRTYTM